MAGHKKTSTLDVTTRALPFLCSKFKMETASVLSLTLNGHVTVSFSVIVMPCCLIFQAKQSTQTKKQARKYGVAAAMALVSVEAI